MTKKHITDVVIELTEKQLLYIEYGEAATPQALGVSTSTIKSWEKIPYFRGVWYAVHENQGIYGEDNPLIQFHEIEDYKKQLQAAALAFEGFSFQEIETHLNLGANTLLNWEAGKLGKDRKTSAGERKQQEAAVFKQVLTEIELTDPSAVSKMEQEQQEKDQKTEANRTKLKSKQSSAIDLLASGKTVSQVAAEIGVTRQTIYNWQAKDGDFQDEFGQKLAELKQSQSQRTAEIVEKAFAAIASLLDSEDEKVRLKAATEVLKGLRWNATTELDAVLIGAKTSLQSIDELKNCQRPYRSARQIS